MSYKFLLNFDVFHFLVLSCFSCVFSTVKAQSCGGSLEASGQAQELLIPAVEGTLDCRWVIRTTSSDGYVRLTVESLNLPQTDGCT